MCARATVAGAFSVINSGRPAGQGAVKWVCTGQTARLRCRVFRECRVFRAGCGKLYIDGKLYKIFAGRVTRQPQIRYGFAHPSAAADVLT